MAFSKITSPATWLNGTVVAPAWAQTVQDDINQMIVNPTTAQVVQCTLTKGAAVGTGGSAFFSAGTAFDMCGSVQIGSGTAPGPGILGTVTFVTTTLTTATYVNGPVILLTPLNQYAANIAVANQVYAVGTQAAGVWTGWTLNTAGTINTGGNNAAWSYLVFMC